MTYAVTLSGVNINKTAYNYKLRLALALQLFLLLLHNLCVDLCSARWLVSVHSGRGSGVLLQSRDLGGVLALIGSLLGCEAVGERALVLYAVSHAAVSENSLESELSWALSVPSLNLSSSEPMLIDVVERVGMRVWEAVGGGDQPFGLPKPRLFKSPQAVSSPLVNLPHKDTKDPS